MFEPSFVTVRNGAIDLRVAVTGTGPLILCIHGWPELWYSWRHQMEHFAARGFTSERILTPRSRAGAGFTKHGSSTRPA